MAAFSANQLICAAALAISSFSAGFFLGTHTEASSSHNSTSPELGSPAASDGHDNKAPAEQIGSDDEDEDGLPDGDLSAVTAGVFEPCKMVLVVRTDVNMSPGKVAAQCGHATLACYKALIKKNPHLVKHWERTGQAKIALKAKSEDQLLELEAIAKSLNLCARSIQDAGHTEVEAGTRTVLGIGPAPVALVNEVTGKLRLY